MPSVAGMRLWISFDDGAHGQEVRLRNVGSANHSALLAIAPLNRTAGHVGLDTAAGATVVIGRPRGHTVKAM